MGMPRGRQAVFSTAGKTHGASRLKGRRGNCPARATMDRSTNRPAIA
jgi:hypothetical protein